MILQKSDARRFEKLFYGFIDSLAPKFGYKSSPRYPCDNLSAGEYGDIMDGVWGEFGDLSLIDEFVNNNPLRFNRTDLREVQSWKNALMSDFIIVRDGRDVLFLFGDYSFAVRGVYEEVEYELGITLPSCCTAIILPFAGLLTHGMAAITLPIDILENENNGFNQEIARNRREGRHISTARDYFKKLPDALKAEQAFRANLEKEGHGDSYDQPPAEQHRGMLAGLSPQERADAVERHEELLGEARSSEERRRDYNDLRQAIDAECVEGAYAWTLAQAFDKLDDDELFRLASKYDAEELFAEDRQRLVRELAQVCDKSSEAFLYKATLRGPWAVEELQSLYKADGVLRFLDYGTDLVNVLHPLPPCIQLYHREREFVCIMPREVSEALRHADWNKHLKHARVLNQAYNYLDALQDMCGVVRMDEALAECMEYVGEGVTNIGELLDLVEERQEQGSVALYIIEGESYFVEPDIITLELASHDPATLEEEKELVEALQCYLIGEGDLQALIDGVDHNIVRDILHQQEGKPPCPPSEAIIEHGVATATMDAPEAQALVAYLDEFVPDGQDDYTFATNAVRGIINTARDLPDIERIFKILSDAGFVPTREQVGEMMPLIMELLKVIPKWTHNGWTARDVPLDDDSVHPIVFTDLSIPVRD